MATFGSNIFNTMNFGNNFDGTCDVCEKYGIKNLKKIGRELFVSKY